MWVKDPACLSEACRLVGTAIMAESGTPWLQAVQQNTDLLPHLLWIVQNTLNESLLERYLQMKAILSSHTNFLPPS